MFSSPIQDSESIDPHFDAYRDVRILLSTRQNRNNPQQLQFRNLLSVQQSNFNRNRPTRILVHGWFEDDTSDISTATSAELLDYQDFNVIFIDWSEGSRTLNYIGAANRVPTVGTFIASYVDFLHENGMIAFNRLTVIGFSLGAHIAGHSGKRVRRGRINSILGLDPAGKFFLMLLLWNKVWLIVHYQAHFSVSATLKAVSMPTMLITSNVSTPMDQQLSWLELELEHQLVTLISSLTVVTHNLDVWPTLVLMDVLSISMLNRFATTASTLWDAQPVMTSVQDAAHWHQVPGWVEIHSISTRAFQDRSIWRRTGIHLTLEGQPDHNFFNSTTFFSIKFSFHFKFSQTFNESQFKVFL